MEKNKLSKKITVEKQKVKRILIRFGLSLYNHNALCEHKEKDNAHNEINSENF